MPCDMRRKPNNILKTRIVSEKSLCFGFSENRN